MSNLKPGEFRITDQAMKKWNLAKGATVLDIGCGQGETVEYLEKEYGYQANGIDLSKDMIKEGLSRNPKLNIKYGDGEFLEDYTSFSLDGVLMECTLSLVAMPDEALHEVYCVLKKGGKLFISDLYLKNPTPEFMKELELEAERQKNLPHEEGSCGGDHGHDHGHDQLAEACGGTSEGGCGDCTLCTETACGDCTQSTESGTGDCGGHEEGEEHEHDFEYTHDRKKAVSFRASGRFLKTPLMEQLERMGYTNVAWEDCSQELDTYVAEKLMSDGTLEGCFCEESLHPKDEYKTGYFMLTAEKPL